jgi:hypothetical protein
MGPLPRRALAPLLVVVAVLFAVQELWQLLPLATGCDFLPLRYAAQTLLAGEPVYRDPSFVYPPTAAVALLPMAAAGETAAYAWWLLAGVAGSLLATVLIVRTAPRGSRAAYTAALVVALFGGVVAHRSRYTGNLSELLVPVAVGVLLAFHRGRWLLGCALLAASLLVKPLLAPLVLVPLLHRRWPQVAVTMIPAAVLLLAGMLLIPGGTRFPTVFLHTLAGSNLHGDQAVNNLSLRGWAEAHGVPGALGVAAALVLAAVVLVRARGQKHLGAVLLLGTFLIGGLSEISYLPVALAVALLQAATERYRGLLLLPGFVMLAAPAAVVSALLPTDGAMQTWLVLGELLLLGGLLAPLPPLAHPALDAASDNTGDDQYSGADQDLRPRGSAA